MKDCKHEHILIEVLSRVKAHYSWEGEHPQIKEFAQDYPQYSAYCKICKIPLYRYNQDKLQAKVNKIKNAQQYMELTELDNICFRGY